MSSTSSRLFCEKDQFLFQSNEITFLRIVKRVQNYSLYFATLRTISISPIRLCSYTSHWQYFPSDSLSKSWSLVRAPFWILFNFEFQFCFISFRLNSLFLVVYFDFYVSAKQEQLFFVTNYFFLSHLY